jgi:hypothetical protein
MDPACAGIKTTGLWAMREALKKWEQKQGIERPKFGRYGFSDKRPKFTEPKSAPKPKPKIKVPRDAAKKPRAPSPSLRKYDPAIPRSQRPAWIAYRKKYDAEHPLTEDQRKAKAERCRAYRAKYSPEKKAAELARVREWKRANRVPVNRKPDSATPV